MLLADVCAMVVRRPVWPSSGATAVPFPCRFLYDYRLPCDLRSFFVHVWCPFLGSFLCLATGSYTVLLLPFFCVYQLLIFYWDFFYAYSCKISADGGVSVVLQLFGLLLASYEVSILHLFLLHLHVLSRCAYCLITAGAILTCCGLLPHMFVLMWLTRHRCVTFELPVG